MIFPPLSAQSPLTHQPTHGFTIRFFDKMQKQEIQWTLNNFIFSLHYFMWKKKTQPDFLTRKPSRLKASCLILKHLPGAAEIAEETEGEVKQTFKRAWYKEHTPLASLC